MALSGDNIRTIVDDTPIMSIDALLKESSYNPRLITGKIKRYDDDRGILNGAFLLTIVDSSNHERSIVTGAHYHPLSKDSRIIADAISKIRATKGEEITALVQKYNLPPEGYILKELRFCGTTFKF